MIILKNSGEIDIDVIKTMGVNVKENESAIGYFGTGLKYAIAVFLREGIKMQLWIGDNHYEFYSETKTIRGKDFEMCKMRGPYDSVDLGFTTDLGRNWKVWQAYREIHSNCLDEHGEIYRDTKAFGEAGCTTFAIDDINTDGIFLHQMDNELLWANEQIAIYQGESDCIYYRGIRAKDLDKPSLYTYNIKRQCDLTEDRLLCYDWDVQYAINDAVARMENEGIIKTVITAGRDRFESTLNMRHWTNNKPSEKFMSIAHAHSKDVNYSAREYAKQHAPAAPKTRKEKHLDCLAQLEDFCESFGLEYEIEDGQVTITGELINDED